MLLNVLLRQEQGLNHTKIQEIKGHLNSWTNYEVKKSVQNVAQRVDQNVQAEFRRLFLHKLRDSRTLSRTCKLYVTWTNVQESTSAWINQAIKAFTRLMSKRIFNVHLRLWTLKCKDYSKREYHPRCFNHCYSVLFHY